MNPHLRERVLAQVRAEPAPARREMGRRLLYGLVVTIAFESFLVGLLGTHGGSRPVWLIAGSTGAALAVALVTSWLAFGRGRSMVGRPRGVMVAVALGVVPVLVAAMALLDEAASPAEQGLAPAGNTAQCFALTALFSLVPLALLVLVRRASDPVHPKSTGAALGAAAGAWAAVAMSVVCPYAELSHEVVGHLAPILVVVALGTWAGRSIVGLRGSKHRVRAAA